LDIEMEPDWSRAWEQFLDAYHFEEDVYRRGSDGNGVRFADTPNDPEGLIARSRAAALAKELTVRQYADLRARVRLPGESSTDPDEWLDWKKFGGRLRADMPAELYLQTLVFRAFRPAPFRFPTYSGEYVPLESLEIVPRLLTPVTHDPVTGLMKWEAGLPLDGNGYAIVQGYQVGQDAFRTLRPESFNVADFLARQEVWQTASFQVDDTGEGVPFVVFDEPVIRSADLFEQSADTNDYPVLRARFTLSVPAVRACLVFAGERFQFVAGEGPRDHAEPIANLNGEFVTTAHGGTALEELPYADGKSVTRKAAEIADVLLRRPFQYAEGGYRVQGSNGTQLSSLIDRVSVHVTPQGVWEEVDFTKERRRDAFEPERNLDRIKREQALLPGQEELREQARQLRLLAAGMKANPGFRRMLVDFLRGSEETALLRPSDGTNPSPLPVGTPLWREPNGRAATAAPSPSANVFVGVTVRDQERAVGKVPVRSSGEVLARVQGPVKANDPVGKAALALTQAGHLVAGGQSPVGQALADIAGAVVNLIPVRLGAGGGGATPVVSGHPFEILPAGNDQVKVRAESFILRGLDVKETISIGGLDVPFTPTHLDLVWLELWFAFTEPGGMGGDCYEARICHGPRWASYPKAVQVVKKRGQTPEETIPDDTLLEEITRQQWVGVPEADVAGKVQAIRQKLNLMPSAPESLRKQMRAFVLIGFAAKGDLAGVKVKDFTMVQCLRTHLMLAWFCDNGVPVQWPLAAPMPILELPLVEIARQDGRIRLSCAEFPAAVIRFRVVPRADTTQPTEQNTEVYSAPFDPNEARFGSGERKVQAFATAVGYPRGPVAEENL
jgi:hypothetical protein